MCALIEGKQSIENRKMERYRFFFGSLMAIYINAHQSKGERPKQWNDIFITQKEMNETELEDAIESFFKTVNLNG